MIKLTWTTPPLIFLDLGGIIEVLVKRLHSPLELRRLGQRNPLDGVGD